MENSNIDERWLIDRRDEILKSARKYHSLSLLLSLFLLALALVDERGLYLEEMRNAVKSYNQNLKQLETYFNLPRYSVPRRQFFKEKTVLAVQVHLGTRLEKVIENGETRHDKILAIKMPKEAIQLRTLYSEFFYEPYEWEYGPLPQDFGLIGDCWLTMNDIQWSRKRSVFRSVIRGKAKHLLNLSTRIDVASFLPLYIPQISPIESQYIQKLDDSRTRWQENFEKLSANKMRIPTLEVEIDPYRFPYFGYLAVLFSLGISFIVRYKALRSCNNCPVDHPFAWLPELGDKKWRVFLGYPWLLMPLVIASIASSSLLGFGNSKIVVVLIMLTFVYFLTLEYLLYKKSKE